MYREIKVVSQIITYDCKAKEGYYQIRVTSDPIFEIVQGKCICN